MRKADRGERWQPGLSETLLWCGVPQDRQAGASASEKGAAGGLPLSSLRSKVWARCCVAVTSDASLLREPSCDGCVKLHQTPGDAERSWPGRRPKRDS